MTPPATSRPVVLMLVGTITPHRDLTDHLSVHAGEERREQYLDNFIRNYNVSGENEAASEKWLNQPMPDFLK